MVGPLDTMMAGSSAGNISRHATPVPDINDQWMALMIHLRANPLAPSTTPVIPVGTPITFFGPIHAAHISGMMTARGIPIALQIPQTTTSTTAEACWTYYNQGVQHGITLPSLLPGNATQTQQAPALRLHEPENFDGTRAKFSKFMTQLALVFSSDPARYSTDTAKITYAASYLSASAADWFEPHLNKATGQIGFTTYEPFIRSLKNAYDDPDAHATAERKLHNLKQGDKDCSAYHVEFSTYPTTLKYNDITKISFFSNGANQGLKTALSHQASPPDTFDKFVQLCIKLDNKAKLLRSQSSRLVYQNAPAHAPTPPTRPTPSTTSGTAAGPMDLSQAARTPGKRGPISLKLRKYRHESQLCMYCGGLGH